MECEKVFLLATLLVIQFWSLRAESDACSINSCQCTRNLYTSNEDVICYVTSITPGDVTITALPSTIQSLTVTCTNPNSFTFLSSGIFVKFPDLRSLTIKECNIKTITEESFKGLILLTNLSISESTLPPLPNNTFKYLPNLLFLSIVAGNISSLPDIFILKSLQFLNVSHNSLRNIQIEISRTISDAIDRNDSDDLQNLQIIDLSYNRFSVFPVGLLTRTPRLQELYLVGITLTKLSIPETLKLKDLRIIDARENLLDDVDIYSLSTATALQELHLEGTGRPLNFSGLSVMVHLKKLSLENFAITDSVWEELNLPALATLNLNSNNLTTVDVSRLPNLKLLHLSRNRILHLSNTTFNNQPNLLLLNLSQNILQELPAHVFTANLNLKALDLSSNNISSLANEVLAGRDQLFFLNLSNNILSSLNDTIFKDLKSMWYLYLSSNQLRHLPRLSYMTKLIYLDISSNQISQIEPQDFAGLEKLVLLFFNDNKLTFLPPELFSLCPEVRLVYFENNQISSLGTFGSHHNLRLLSLSNNLLSDFTTESPFIHLRNLEFLFLGSNNLTTLTNNMFPQSITLLYLSDNRLSFINPTSFIGLPRLNFVSLVGQKVFLNIPQRAVSVFKNHSPKPSFDIGGNQLNCNCEMSYLKLMVEANSSINVFNIYYPLFLGLDNLKCYMPHEGILRPFLKVQLQEFVCDYDYTWCDFTCPCCTQDTQCNCAISCPNECQCIYGGSSFIQLFISINCSTKYLEQVPLNIPPRAVVLYLDGNNLSYLLKQDFRNLIKTEEIYLNNSGIKSIENGTFESISALKILQLNDNFLTAIDEDLFGKMESVKQIYLHDNLIKRISSLSFVSLSSVELITLHNNRLQVLETVLKIPHPLSLTLSGNPWSCDCDISQVIIRNIYEINKFILDVDKMCCYFYKKQTDQSGSALSRTNMNNNRNTFINSEPFADVGPSTEEFSRVPTNFSSECFPFLRFNYEKYCSQTSANSTLSVSSNASGLQPGFISLIVITIILLFIAGAVLLFIFKREEVQAWVFVRLGVRILDKRAHLDKTDDGVKIFDAFISYNNKDAEFVATHLVPRLENGDRRYHLCVHYRDFPVGRNITDTICRAIENSHRTIILLSENFLTSEWCRFEFQTAHHYILREGSHKLIIVILGDIQEEMLDPDLKVQLKSKTYLKYGDPWFWEKLYFALPSVKHRQALDDNWEQEVLRGMRVLEGDGSPEERDIQNLTL